MVMEDFKPSFKKPGDVIKSEEWNRLEENISALKSYIDSMSEKVTLTNLESTVGRSYNLNEVVPGEMRSYGAKNMGLITKQWVTATKGIGDICHFGITDYFDTLYYWSGADNGNKNSLEISYEYVDGDIKKVAPATLYVNDRAKLSASNKDNPYAQFLYSDYGIWYQYKAKNVDPKRPVRYVRFRNVSPDSNPRIGNVLHLKSRVRPVTLG